MRFVPYGQAGSAPNVIVDGAATDNTTLTLSHWPKSGTPHELEADTSAEIVFKYLDSPGLQVPAEIVSNNHFDEDGLVGIFVLLEPSLAEHHRDLLVDVSRAGDFGVYRDRRAARIALALAACASPERSPLGRSLFDLPYPTLTAELYVQLLELLPRLITDLECHRTLWELEDARLSEGETLLDQGIVTIEEHSDLDLAIVRLPRPCHPYALHSRTRCGRLLMVQGSQISFAYRYESWVQLASRRPPPRVDLAPLAEELNREEESGGRWVFDGVQDITPTLHLEDSAATSIPADDILERLERHLRTGVASWNPYDEAPC